MDLQTKALSRKTLEQFTLEKMLYFAVGLVIGIALLFISLSAGRTYILNSTQNMGIVKDTQLGRDMRKPMSLRLTMNTSTGSMSGKTQRLLKRLKQDFQSLQKWTQANT